MAEYSVREQKWEKYGQREFVPINLINCSNLYNFWWVLESEVCQVHNLREAQYTGRPYVSSTENYKQRVLDKLQNDVKKSHSM